METTMKKCFFSMFLSVMAMTLTSTSSHAIDGFKNDFTYKVCARNNGDTVTLNIDMKSTGDRAEFGAVFYKNDGSVLRTFNNFFGSIAGPEWMRGPGEQKIGTKNNKWFSFSMQGKDDGAGWIALKGTAPTTDTSNPDGLVVRSQQALKQRTMQVRLTVTTPDGSTYKPKITGDFSSGGGVAPPQAQANAIDCNAYASQAIAAKGGSDSLGCGFSDGRWDSSFEQHRDWCLANQNNGAPALETAVRTEDLQKCKAEKNAAAQGPKINNETIYAGFTSSDGALGDWSSYREGRELMIDNLVPVRWHDNEDDTMNDDIEVVDVGQGTTVVLFEGAHFQGRKLTLTCGYHELIGEPENEVSSIQIFLSPDVIVCPGRTLVPNEVRNWDND
jgi:hypothetical protein